MIWRELDAESLKKRKSSALTCENRWSSEENIEILMIYRPPIYSVHELNTVATAKLLAFNDMR
jgi:hypothetical protein